MGGGVKVLNLSTLQKKIKTKHDKKRRQDTDLGLADVIVSVGISSKLLHFTAQLKPSRWSY